MRPKIERWLLARLANLGATIAEGVRRGLIDFACAMDNRDARERMNEQEKRESDRRDD